MIPDFPKEKEKLMKILNRIMRNKNKEYLGFFATVPAYSHMEGDRWTLGKQDEGNEELEYEELSIQYSFELADVPSMTLEKLVLKMSEVARESAQKMKRHMMETITQDLEASGRGINAKGRKLSPDLFLELLASMDLSFDKNGELIPPALIMHPDLWEARKDDMMQWEKDPEFTMRHERIIFKKREEWHARESRRKLVD